MRFLLTMSVVTGLIFLIYWQASIPFPSYYFETIVLLLIGTIGLYFYLVDVKKERPEYFIQLYLTTLFAKLLAYGGYVFFMVWDAPAEAAPNALFFMVTYILFTGVEVIFLYWKVSQ